MGKYRSYKSSNLKWAGEIPSDWEVSKIKFVTNNEDGKREPISGEFRYDRRGDYPYYGATGIVDFIDDYRFDGRYLLIGEDGAPFFIPNKHVAFIAEGKFWVNNHAHVLSSKNEVDLMYLCYLLNCVDYREYISGSTRDKLTKSDLSDIKILLPSLDEQIRIAKYLDHQTSIVDQLIQQKEKLIELLKEKRQAVINEAVTKGLDPSAKMKDSGIESFGHIPENWEVTKLKYISDVKGRIGFRGYTTDDLVEEGNGALALGATHITWEGDIDLSSPVFISWPKYEESPEIKLNIDDIIIVQRGSTCGKVGIISSEIGPATINPSLVVLKEVKADPYYVFVSIKAALQELINLTRSAAIPMLSQEQIGNLQIVLPPITEQKIVSEFLKETKTNFNDSINKLTDSIAKLQEYRQSIISEAVTGKIDVRDWQPNTKQVA